MTRLIIDSGTVAKLNDLSEPLELCDSTGRLLGYFTPAEDKSLYGKHEPPPLSEEEWQRRENEPGGRSLSEILRDLESRS